MAWLSRNDLSRSDKLINDMLNSLANDDRNWGGNVNGGGYMLSNVILAGSGGFQYHPSALEITPGADGHSVVQVDQTVGPDQIARWRFGKNATAETGANTGSDYTIARYSDAGAVLGTPFWIRRSDGLITMGSQKWTGPIDGGGQTITNVVIPGTGQTPWVSDIEGGGFRLKSAGHIGIANDLAALPVGDASKQLVVGGADFGRVTVAWTAAAGQQVGAYAFANYSIGVADKRIAQIHANADGATNSGALVFTTSAIGTLGERMRITAAGDLALGSTTVSLGTTFDPTRRYLTVKGPTGAGVLELAYGGPDTDNVNAGAFYFTDPNMSGAEKRIISIGGVIDGATAGNRGGRLVFNVKPNGGGTLAARMTINTVGVGVGKTPTTYPLEVAGDIDITGTYRINGVPAGGSANYWANGALVGTRPTLNLVQGSGTIISGTDNAGANRVDITITATGAGGGQPQTPWAQTIDAANFKLHNVDAIGIGMTPAASVPSKMLLVHSPTRVATLAVFSANDGNPSNLSSPSIGFGIGGIAQQWATIGGIQGASGTYSEGSFAISTRTGEVMTERLRILYNGRVGIGRPDPVSLLDLYTANVAAHIDVLTISTGNTSVSSAEQRIKFRSTGTYDLGYLGVGFDPATAADGYMAFGTGGSSAASERMRIKWDGNVGIGNSSPQTLLHLTKNIAGVVGPIIRLENSCGAGNDAVSIQMWDATLRSDLRFVVTSAPWGADMVYYGGGVGTTEVFRATSSGLVGIGTASPQATRLSIVAANATSVATAKQITIGEQTNTAGYYLSLGYMLESGAWKGSIQALSGGAAAPLVLNGMGGSVGIGNNLTALPSGSALIDLVVGGDASTAGRVTVAANAASGAVGVFAFANYATGVAEKRLAQLASFCDGAVNSGNVVFYTNLAGAFAERMRLTSGGNLVLGTPAKPAHQLNIVGPGVTTIAINPETSMGGTLCIDDTGPIGGNGGQIIFGAAAGSWRFAAIKAFALDGTAYGSGSLFFLIRNNTATPTLVEAMRINASKYIGMGGVDPAYQLHVLGDINCTGTFRVNGTPISGGSSYPGLTQMADVTATKALGTGYTNSRGVPTFVSVQIQCLAAHTSTAYADNAADPTTIVSLIQVSTSATIVTLNFFVLTGHKYKVTSGGNIVRWLEWW